MQHKFSAGASVIVMLCCGLAPWLAPGESQARKGGELREPPRVDDRGARFLGPHPIAARLGGGYCYIDAPHLHNYGPDRPALYQQVGDQYLFTGDPVPFGYDGERTVYYGAHPVPIRVDLPFAPPSVYCSLRGPHYHEYAPPPMPEYKIQNNVVFYVGPMDPGYVRVRPQLERGVEAEYRPYVSMRPQVVVTPPPEWHGEVWVAPPAPGVVNVVAPQAPSVNVVAPQAPSVHVVAPQPPSVYIGAPQPPSVHIVAPQPPSVHIVAPQPPSLYIGAPAPPAVYVAPGPVYVGHPGKHKGWYKHEGHERHEGHGHGHGHR